MQQPTIYFDFTAGLGRSPVPLNLTDEQRKNVHVATLTPQDAEKLYPVRGIAERLCTAWNAVNMARETKSDRALRHAGGCVQRWTERCSALRVLLAPHIGPRRATREQTRVHQLVNAILDAAQGKRELPAYRAIERVFDRLSAYQESIGADRSEIARVAALIAEANAAKKPKKRRGRQQADDKGLGKRVEEAWATRRYRTLADLADALHEDHDKVYLVHDKMRQRAKRLRRAVKPR